MLGGVRGRELITPSYSIVGQEDKIISMKIGFVHKNMLRGNPGTEKCNQLQKSSLKERINMEIKREYYLDKLIKRQNNGVSVGLN